MIKIYCMKRFQLKKRVWGQFCALLTLLSLGLTASRHLPFPSGSPAPEVAEPQLSTNC